MTIKDHIKEVAILCGFEPHPIHGGLVVRASDGGWWKDISRGLENFAEMLLQQSNEDRQELVDALKVAYKFIPPNAIDADAWRAGDSSEDAYINTKIRHLIEKFEE